MSDKWFIVTLQNYKKEGFRLLSGALLIIVLLFVTAYDNGMNVVDFFQLTFALKVESAAFKGIYTGLVSIFVMIPVRYIELINVNNYKEFALRINDRKKFNSMVSHGVFALVFIEFLAVFLFMGILSILLPKSENILLNIIPMFMIYMLMTYLTAVWYYQLSSREYGQGVLLGIALSVHINNVFSIVQPVSVPYILIHQGITYHCFFIAALLVIIFISTKITLKKKENVSND